METTDNKKSNKILYEIRDMLTGAAFPIMLQLIFSTSIILFADYNEEPVLQVFVLVFGEILLAGAYVVFGRQNGLAAYRRTVLGEKKRAGGTADKRALYKTGEYALWKGFVIGAVSCVPFVVFQFIQCVAPNIVCEFILKYAFGWAVYPFSPVRRKSFALAQFHMGGNSRMHTCACLLYRRARREKAAVEG